MTGSPTGPHHGPVTGDAFGLLLRHTMGRQEEGTLRIHPLFEIVERDDGVIAVGPAKFYLSEPAGWLPCERSVVDKLDGRVLDIGAGAGRLALYLQATGTRVTALDTSPGAIAVCRRRGVEETVCATIDRHAASGERYDSFALFGNNLGLLESRERAADVLDTLAAMARPGARIVGVNVDPHRTPDPVTAAYLTRNEGAGRLPGQIRVRERFQGVATPWFDFLWCSAAELDKLVAGSRWRLVDVEPGVGPSYAATLVLSG